MKRAEIDIDDLKDCIERLSVVKNKLDGIVADPFVNDIDNVLICLKEALRESRGK